MFVMGVRWLEEMVEMKEDGEEKSKNSGVKKNERAWSLNR